MRTTKKLSAGLVCLLARNKGFSGECQPPYPLLRLTIVTLISALALTGSPAMGSAASAGALDTSFNVGSGGYGVNVVLLQPDGRVIIAGTFTSYHSVFRQGIARLNEDASVDLSFDAGRVAASGNGVKSAYLYPDGRILVAGGFYSNGRSRIARFNSDGTLDPSFDPGAGPNGDIDCLAMQTDGKIIIGGTFTSVSGQPLARLARLNADGSLDTNFVASADNDVHALALQPDGKILVAGWFSHLNSVSPAYLARLNSDGTLDPSFVSKVTQPVECMAVQTDARILIGGSFSFSGGSPLARVMPDGSWDASFSTAVGAWIQAIRIQDDGRILIGGSFTTVNGASRPYMARLYSDGSTDLSFSSAPDNLVDVIAIQLDGRCIIAGGFGNVQGTPEGGLARLYGDDRTAAPCIQINGTAFNAFQSSPFANIPIFRSGDTNAAVSVQYGTAGLEAQAETDYIETSGILSFAPGEIVKSIAVPLLNDGEVASFERFGFFLTNVVGGVLGTITNATVTVLGVNGSVQFIASEIVTNELAGALNITITRAATNLTSSVLCQAVSGTAIADIHFRSLSQTITLLPGQTTTNLTLTLLDDDQPGPDKSFTVQLSNPVNATIGSRSNLTVTILDNDAPGYPAFGLNGYVNAVVPTSDGGALLGGSFISINGTPRNRLGKVLPDGSLDQGFNPGVGLDNGVYAVLLDPDGKVVCGGNFTACNGTARTRVARLNPDASLDATFAPGAGANDIVWALVPASDGGYFAGGWFNQYGGVSRRGVVKINPDGSVNTSFVPQMPSGSLHVQCLAAQPGGRVLVGGNIWPDSATNACFRLNPDGSRDNTFICRLTSSTGISISSFAPQPDGKIVVGGSFSYGGIARLNANGSLDSTFATFAGANGAMTKLLLLANGQIMAAGTFISYAGVPRNRLVRINSNGSIDPGFNPGLGPDALITDVAPLAGNRWAVGGQFRKFGGFPRYYLAILDSTGKLITQVECKTFVAGDHLQFGLLVEPEKPFEILASTDLVNWQVAYSNLLHTCFTNLALPKPDGDKQFFRVLQTR